MMREGKKAPKPRSDKRSDKRSSVEQEMEQSFPEEPSPLQKWVTESAPLLRELLLEATSRGSAPGRYFVEKYREGRPSEPDIGFKLRALREGKRRGYIQQNMPDKIALRPWGGTSPAVPIPGHTKTLMGWSGKA